MIGDGDRDVEAAEKLGINGIKVSPNSNIFDVCNELIQT
jgi:histidinol phosphatase-like enzyme